MTLFRCLMRHGSAFQKLHATQVRRQEFHARATRNVDPKILKLFSAHVSRTTYLRLLLKSYSDAELKFRTDNFLVTRIDGTDLTIAGGQEFPQRAISKLAKQLRAMDFHVELVTPESLLKRNDSEGQEEPEFVVPFVGESEE